MSEYLKGFLSCIGMIAVFIFCVGLYAVINFKIGDVFGPEEPTPEPEPRQKLKVLRGNMDRQDDFD